MAGAQATAARVARALTCGAPLLVREVWACLGVTCGPETAEVAEALRALERDGQARCNLETMRWEMTR